MIRRAGWARVVSMVTLLGAVQLPAQPARSAAAPPPAADSVAISVLTFGPGEELFDRFGHMAVRVRFPRLSIDSAYNWGMYSFDEPHFIWRFMTGDTRYWMQGFPTDFFVDSYRRAGRAVYEQDLALTRVEADSLARYIAWNARAENRYYRYDYFVDNCSTRLRDVLDKVLSGAVRASLEARKTSVTYREETIRLAADFPVIDLGMDFVLGPRTDAPLNGWEAGFIPMRLRDLLDSVTVASPDRTRRPLVSARRTLVPETTFREPASLPRLALLGLSLAVTISAVALALAPAAGRSDPARLSLIGLTTIWHFTAGMAGILLLFAGLFTRHVFMGMNANVMLGTPVSLALAVTIPLSLKSVATERLIRLTIGLAWVAAGCALAALLLKALPVATPRNWAALALAVPAHLGTALALRRALRASSPAA